ncbi:four helix bundle protein [Luteolibacter sp. Populi]|uniref:four helix bundle protein n=1 Tax=Luteolibacter sp. Populi TaxID=3230487 RepID=UPI00346759F3
MEKKDGGEGKFDLEERTFQFALRIRQCVSTHRWTRGQWTDLKQLLRSSGSVAANYVEADNAASRPDFIYRIGVSKKEAVESRLWLRLLGATTTAPPAIEALRPLYREADELTRILAAILRSSK